jgi:hypothetical protein
MHHILNVIHEAAVWVGMAMMRHQWFHVDFVMIAERIGLAPGVSIISEMPELGFILFQLIVQSLLLFLDLLLVFLHFSDITA